MRATAGFITIEDQSEGFSFGSFLPDDDRVTVRRAREDDRRRVLAFLRMEEGVPQEGGNPFADEAGVFDIDAVDDGRSRMWVAHCGDGIIGIAELRLAAGCAWLGHLVVSRTWQGDRQALARHLSRTVMVAAFSQGFEALRMSRPIRFQDRQGDLEPVGRGGGNGGIAR